jgi:KDO2-lipid IV(A) lauroyltransferase
MERTGYCVVEEVTSAERVAGRIDALYFYFPRAFGTIYIDGLRTVLFVHQGRTTMKGWLVGKFPSSEAGGTHGLLERAWFRAEYAVAWPLIKMVRCFPPWLAVSFGTRLGQLGFFLRLRRSVGEENLRIALPELSDLERRRILQRSYENLARTLLEIVRLPALSDESIRARVRYDPASLDNLARVASRGKGVLFITAHLGNFELLALSHALHHKPSYVVGKVLRNPLFDRDLMRSRVRAGNLMSTRQDFSSMRGMILHMKDGGTVGLLIDQCPRRGTIVPFFGQDTLCHRGPASLALRTGAAVVPAFIRPDPQVDGGRILYLGPEVQVEPGKTSEEKIRLLTARMQEVIEKEVRARPQEWLWTHKRWKRTPTQVASYSRSARRRRRTERKRRGIENEARDSEAV